MTEIEKLKFPIIPEIDYTYTENPVTYYPQYDNKEIRLREKAIEQTTIYFKDKTSVSESVFMTHLEKVYLFLKTGSTTPEFLTNNKQ